MAQPSDHSYLFDITSLVRQWYSNPSAQNMGVIFKASDAVEGASAHNHKTFGSYSSSYRPVFTLVYENVTPIVLFPSDLDLREGESYTLLTGSNLSGATISWSSADSSIAMCGTYVGTSTTVTAQKAGTTTITATATSDGLTYTATCEVNVYLPDGVYYIKNMNSNRYLHVDEGGVTNETDVIQYTKYSDSMDDVYKIRQMWKIHHIVNGIYSIRPMNSLDMGLHVDDGNVDIYNIGTNDTIYDVIEDALWTIEWRSNGYVFKNNNSDNAVMQIENSSTQTLASVKAGAYSSSLNCKWALTKVENPPSGVVLYDLLNKAVITEAPTKRINVGETKSLFKLDLCASVYSENSILQTLTWSSDNPSVLTVNSSTGEITGVTVGKATVTGKRYGKEVSFDVCVGYPDFFENMIDDGLFAADTVDNTDDGFFISLVPISTILNANGIDELPKNSDGNSTRNVLAYYDDWYIFSVVNGTTTKYGLYKMREQEYDSDDENDPCVSISFVAFDISRFNTCLSTPTANNRYNLLVHLDQVTGPGLFDTDGDGDTGDEYNLHDTDIATYFCNVESDGSYLIANKFINKIVQTSVDGIIELPNSFPENNSTLENQLDEINAAANATIYDRENRVVRINNPDELSAYEKRAILATHTMNASLNSFAAEVWFHADALTAWYKYFKTNTFGDPYECALRADMGIGEGKYIPFFTQYYDLESDLVQDQIAAHGEQ